jgi:hypothetical protein
LVHLFQFGVAPAEAAQWFGQVARQRWHRRRTRWCRLLCCEGRVVVQDAGLQVTQRRCGVNPELVDQAVTDLGEGTQGFGLAPSSIERQHEQLPKTLAQRVVPAQRFELAYQLVVMAEPQVRFDSVLRRHQG